VKSVAGAGWWFHVTLCTNEEDVLCFFYDCVTTVQVKKWHRVRTRWHRGTVIQDTCLLQIDETWGVERVIAACMVLADS